MLDISVVPERFGTHSANFAENCDSTGAVLLEVVETPADVSTTGVQTGLRSLGKTVDTCSATVLWRFGRISLIFFVLLSTAGAVCSYMLRLSTCTWKIRFISMSLLYLRRYGRCGTDRGVMPQIKEIVLMPQVQFQRLSAATVVSRTVEVFQIKFIAGVGRTLSFATETGTIQRSIAAMKFF